MPGMLTPEQMAQLDSARGPAFDRLFLTFMIQHHQGAITMVQQLLAVPGAAQDGPIFRFASDVNVDQTTEINRNDPHVGRPQTELSVKSRLLLALSFVIWGSAAAQTSAATQRQDPRIGLRAGWFTAGQANWNMRLVSTTAALRPNSSIAIRRAISASSTPISRSAATTSIQGNFNGIQVWDISTLRFHACTKPSSVPDRRATCRSIAISCSCRRSAQRAHRLRHPGRLGHRQP